jgi:hypothetical protein
VVQARVRQVLELYAIFLAVVGVLLLLASWDDLYSVLDLPRPEPALFGQLGGIAMIGLAYLLWAASRAGELARSAAVAGTATNALGALLVGSWVLFRDLDIWGVDALGYALLAILTVLLAIFAVAYALIAARTSARR